MKMKNYCWKMTHTLANLSVSSNSPIAFNINGLFQYFFELALKNQDVSFKKSQYHNRLNDTVKHFSIYLFVIGGRLLYETMYYNMKNVLPPITTIFQYIY